MAEHIADGTGNAYLAEVTSENQLKTFGTNADLEIGIGNVPGRSLRGVSGEKLATTTEGVISSGLTGRYPFPSIAAQMDIVSSDANDIAGGTGLQTVLIRGLTVSGSDWVDDSEIIALDGTDPVTTIKSFIRVNSLVAITVGSTGSNEGTITMTNGADTLHVMEIGENVTRAVIWSTASNLPAYVRRAVFIAGKSVNNVIFRTYIDATTPTDFPSALAFKFVSFEGIVGIPFIVPFELGGGSDIEITAESSLSTVAANALLEMTLVETT